MSKKVFLMILDGWGHGPDPKVSALAQASTPYIDSLYNKYPNAELITYGEDVGLPKGQMGNSEVGHLNIGAGRIVFQELARINNAVRDNVLQENNVLKDVITKAKSSNKRIHLMGLLSDGGVHSHINHLKALCDILEAEGLEKVYIHAFLDGRDTDPKGGKSYIKDLLDHLKGKQTQLATIIGRYYAMDRDQRWERTKDAYDLLVKGIAKVSTGKPEETLQEQYDLGITDEFMVPISVNTLNTGESHNIQDGDIVLCFNFRTDRPRQICRVLSQENFEEFDMTQLDIEMVTMTEYSEDFQDVKVLFTKENLNNTLGQVLADNNRTQLRIAETEKYPHVTFFFSGGDENPLRGEKRILINSPKVATYDLKPEMSAYELTNAVHNYIEEAHPDFIVLNYANADMVGHTGVFDAAIKAAETLDSCLESLIPVLEKKDYLTIVIADHGNSDCLINVDGSPNTAHTKNPVPIIVIDPKDSIRNVKDGKLADIAVSILKYMKIQIPPEMTGNVIFS